MAGRRLSSIALLAAACAGASAWFSAGALAVIDAGPRAPRVGILPPLWTLPALVLASVAIVWLGRLPRDRAWPLFLPLLTMLPWMPGPVPLPVWMWTGPIVVLVWIVAIVGVVLPATPRAFAPSWLSDPRRAPFAAAALAFALYVGAAAHLSFAVSGDEPHYLIITQSLLHDRDVRIENNHRAGQFTPYVRGELKPHYLRRGRDGQIYSIHAPGLPALIAPAFAFFGYRGAMVFLALLAAAATGLVWRACAAVTTTPAAAWFGWASVALTVPFFFQSFAVYPEAVGAALVMCGVFALIDIAAPVYRWFWYGAALALLPWVHTRLAIAAAALGLAIVVRLLTRGDWPRAVALFLTVPLVSAIAWFGFFYAVYGSINPASPYGADTQSAVSNIPSGLGGLLFDQQFGIVPNAPVLAVALVGLISFARSHTRLAGEILLTVGPYALAASAYHMWWGGRSSPGRFLVAVLLPLALPAAHAFEHARTATLRALWVMALAISVTITAVMLLPGHGRLILNSRDGVALWLEWISPLVDLPRGFPSFLRDPPAVAFAHAGWWAVVVGAVTAGVVRVTRRRTLEGGQRMLVAGAGLAVAVMIAVDGLWTVNGVREPTASTAQIAMLRQAARMPHGVALKFSPLQWVSLDSAVGRLDIASSARRPRERAAPELELTRVPAGIYRLHVRAPSGFSGVLQARAGESDSPIETWSVSIDRGRETDVRVVLPVAVSSLDVRRETPTDDPLEVTLRPLSIPARDVPGEAGSAARYGTARVFVMEGLAYLEAGGLWVSSGTTALVIDPPARSLLLRNASRDNVVRIETSGIVERLELRASEVRTLTLPPSAEAHAVIRVTVEVGIVPAVVDPASADYRNLGLWLELR